MKYITEKFVKFLSIGLVFGAASLAQAGEVSTAQLNEDAMAGQQFSVALESVQTDIETKLLATIEKSYNASFNEVALENKIESQGEMFAQVMAE